MKVLAVLLVVLAVASDPGNPAPAPEVAPVPEPTPPAQPEPAPAPKPEPEHAAKKEAAPHEKSTTDKKDVETNVLKVTVDAVKQQLENATFPFAGIIAFVAFIFGAMLIYSGKTSFDILTCFAIGVVVALVTKANVEAYWEDKDAGHSIKLRYDGIIAGIEAGVVAGFAAYKGFSGVLVCIGVASGFFLAHFLGDLLQGIFTPLAKAEFQIAWYSLFVLPLTVFFYKEKHAYLLALISPFIGGLFVSSSFWYCVTELFSHFACKQNGTKCPGDLKPMRGKWIDFFSLLTLLHPHSSDDVGIFAGSEQFNPIVMGSQFYLDQVTMVVFWLLLAGISVNGQLKAHKKFLQRKGSRADSGGITARGREVESLQEELLPREF